MSNRRTWSLAARIARCSPLGRRGAPMFVLRSLPRGPRGRALPLRVVAICIAGFLMNCKNNGDPGQGDAGSPPVHNCPAQDTVLKSPLFPRTLVHTLNA